jgi:cytoskeletal protein CcmA (bactofilin family)
MEQVKVTTYPFDANEKEVVIKTSWGTIIAKGRSFEFHIEGIGQFEVFGWLTLKKQDGKIILCGTEFERGVAVLEGELKA